MTGGLWSGKTLQKVFSKIITKVLFDLKITFDKYDRRSLLSPCFIQSLLSVNKPCVEMNKITMMTVTTKILWSSLDVYSCTCISKEWKFPFVSYFCAKLLKTDIMVTSTEYFDFSSMRVCCFNERGGKTQYWQGLTAAIWGKIYSVWRKVGNIFTR